MKKTHFLVAWFIKWRILLFIPIIIGIVSYPYRVGYEYTNILGQTNNPIVQNPLVYPWANFDGVRYLSIANNGYITEAAFFPLYPLLTRWLSYLFGNDFLSGMIIANICFFISLLLFYNILISRYQESVAKRIIISLLVFPTAFFFACFYSESIFFLIMLMSLFFAQRGDWLKASAFAFILGLTRLIGILIIPALFYELWLQRDKVNIVEKSKYLIIAPLGTGLYALYNFIKWGSPFNFITAHGQLANSRSVDSVILFPQTIYRYFKILMTVPITQHEGFIAGIELLTFIFVTLLLIVAWKNKVRISYLIFSVFAFLVPISSGTFSGLPRYVILLFPIFIALGQIKSKLLFRLYLILGVLLQIILLALFSRGYYIA